MRLWAACSRWAIMAVGCDAPCLRTAGQAGLEYNSRLEA
jgi:hypothetical protein